MNYYKLYFTILLSGLTLFIIIDNVYKYQFSKAQEIIASKQQDDFKTKLNDAMERQKKLQEKSKHNGVQFSNVSISKTKSGLTVEEYKERLAVCNYFTEIYLKNRTKSNEVKYQKACDPYYNDGQTVTHN